MDLAVLHNGTDITNKTLSYSREHNICTGVGIATFNIVANSGITFNPWDTMTIYEGGIKKAIFYVTEYGKGHDSGSLEVKGQDGSIYLSDYFIPEIPTPTEPTTCRYWMERFLDDSTVSYSIIPEGYGNIVAENTAFGLSPLYDTLLTLLQQSGWYFYFDENGTCIINELEKDLDSPDLSVTASEIVDITVKKSDKNLRNRAVVWGNYSGGDWVFADSSVATGYEVAENDIRTVVVANSNIYSSGDAQSIANKLLDEYGDISVEKTVVLAGMYNVIIGNIVQVSSKYYSGIGLITGLRTEVSGSGFRTTLVIDSKCPRLFGFYGYTAWVYTGTDGAGIYRKRLDSATWQDFSQGLNHYNITDLAIKNGVFACIANGWVYVNTETTPEDWKVYDLAFLYDSDDVQYSAMGDYKAIRIDIEESTGNILIIYSLTEEAIAEFGYARSWLVIINTDRERLFHYPIVLESTGNDNLRGVDIASLTDKKIVSVVGNQTAAGEVTARKDIQPSLLGDAKTIVATSPTGSTEITSSNIADGGTLNLTNQGYGLYYNTGFISTYIEGSTIYACSEDEKLTYVSWNNLTKYEVNFELYPTGITYTNYDVNDTKIYRLAEIDRDGNPRNPEDRKIIILHHYGDALGPRYFRATAYTPLVDGYPHMLDDVEVVCRENLSPISGLFNMGGTNLVEGMHVLLSAQTNQTENGTYIAHSGTWERTGDSLSNCAIVKATYGSEYTNSYWQISTSNPIVVGTTNIVFQQVLVPEVHADSLSFGDWESLFPSVYSYQPSEFEIDEGLLYNGVFYIGYYGMSVPTELPDEYTFEVGAVHIDAYVFKYDCETHTYYSGNVFSENAYGFIPYLSSTPECSVEISGAVLLPTLTGATFFFVRSENISNDFHYHVWWYPEDSNPDGCVASGSNLHTQFDLIFVHMDYNSVDVQTTTLFSDDVVYIPPYDECPYYGYPYTEYPWMLVTENFAGDYGPLEKAELILRHYSYIGWHIDIVDSGTVIRDDGIHPHVRVDWEWTRNYFFPGHFNIGDWWGAMPNPEFYFGFEEIMCGIEVCNGAPLDEHERHLDVIDLTGSVVSSNIYDSKESTIESVEPDEECLNGYNPDYMLFIGGDVSEFYDSNYDSWYDLSYPMPIWSKNIGPFFTTHIDWGEDILDVFDGTAIYNHLSTLETPNYYEWYVDSGFLNMWESQMAIQMDEEDDCLYFYDGDQTIIKEHYLGGVVATFDLPSVPTGWASVPKFLTVANGMFIFYGFDSEGLSIMNVYKLKDSLLSKELLVLSETGGTQTYGLILEKNEIDTFDIIDAHDAYELEIESNNNILLSRTVGSGFGSGTDDKEIRFYNAYPLYTTLAGEASDARIVPLSGNLTFEAGNYNLVYNKYGLVLCSGILSLVDIDNPTNIYPLTTISGVVTQSGMHVETTNKTNPQYIFVSADGVFLQRYPTSSSTFNDHSSGMPGQQITCIRIDDKI